MEDTKYFTENVDELADMADRAEKLLGDAPDEDACSNNENEVWASLANLYNAVLNMGVSAKPSRQEELLRNTVDWFLRDCCETAVARNELEEIGFTEDELERYGFPPEA